MNGSNERNRAKSNLFDKDEKIPARGEDAIVDDACLVGEKCG
jgi:hypothetical protein